MNTKHIKPTLLLIVAFFCAIATSAQKPLTKPEKPQTQSPISSPSISQKKPTPSKSAIVDSMSPATSIEVPNEFELIKRKAEAGDVEAQCNLGKYYYDGEGVTRNYEEAAKWWRKAAEQDYAVAQYNLGLCYCYGNGVSQNWREATIWWRKSAEQGEVQAQFNLGLCYYNGDGVTQNKTEAIRWFKKAAEQGNEYAQYNLGVFYYNGDGVTQSYEEAEKWYRKAAEQGNLQAKEALEVLVADIQENNVGNINGHLFVDLGLSVKWATCNVGASSPSDYGNYYAWGEITPKSSYKQENSVTYGKKMEPIMGNDKYDVARAEWKSTWRLPTKSEIEELMNKCTWTWTTQGGHNGYIVMGRNGNSIFLPATGYMLGTSLKYVGKEADYWSATPNETLDGSANKLHIGDRISCGGNSRYFGLPVRPVSK